MRHTAVQHDPAYCDKYRLRGWSCNQPHAASDPHGARQPVLSPFVRRALARELPAKELGR